MEKVLITLCGRAGSKGFRNKNLKMFDGLPLSYYSLAAAEGFIKQNPGVSVEICLNTDSPDLITSPLRQVNDVTGAYQQAKENPECDLVFSVCPARRTPYMNMAKLVDGHAQRVIDHHFTARQQTPPVFDLNASIYVFTRRFLTENTTGFLWDGVCGMYQMFDTGILDIDSEEDYWLMEAIAHHLYETKPEFGKVREAIRR